ERAKPQPFIRAPAPGICCEIIIHFSTQEAIEPEVMEAITLKFYLEGQLHVNRLDRFFFRPVQLAIQYKFLLREYQGRNKAKVNKTRYFQVTHDADVKAGPPLRLDQAKGICLGKYGSRA